MARKITALKQQKRDNERVNVYLNGEFAFGLEKIVAAWLQVGQELSEEKIAELQAKDEVETAFQRALNFLSYRPRTEKEVRANLKRNNVEEGVADEVVQRLRRGGLLDDVQFANLWVENRSEFRPRGRQALRAELRQKGLGDETIEVALSNLNEEELALRAAQKQARKLEALEWPDFRKRLGSFLARRGFGYEIITETLKRVWEQQTRPSPNNQMTK